MSFYSSIFFLLNPIGYKLLLKSKAGDTLDSVSMLYRVPVVNSKKFSSFAFNKVKN